MPTNAVDAVSSDDKRWTERPFSGTESPSLTILEVVSSIKNESIEHLDPLYDVTDPDALNTLLETADSGVCIQFEYAECTVEVTGDRVRAADTQLGQ